MIRVCLSDKKLAHVLELRLLPEKDQVVIGLNDVNVFQPVSIVRLGALILSNEIAQPHAPWTTQLIILVHKCY